MQFLFCKTTGILRFHIPPAARKFVKLVEFYFNIMQILGLVSFAILVFACVLINALPYPAREIRSPAISAAYPHLSPVIRTTRAAEELKKDDLEGSETAFITYPYLGLPYYGYPYYSPHVVYVG